MSPYEMLDAVKEELGASEIADYLFVNYPSFAEGVKHEIEARIYFAVMQDIQLTKGGYDERTNAE
jgi:hypothetical protein